MFGRVFIGIVTIVSVLWLGYATYDRVNQGKAFRPEYVFDKNDGDVLVILNPSKYDVLLNQFGTINTDIIQFILQLNLDQIETIFVSKKRNHILVNTKTGLTNKSFKTIFQNEAGVQIDQNNIKFKTLKGKFNKNVIYLSKDDFKLNANPWDEVLFDKNADGSIIGLMDENQSITDMYIKSNGLIEYKSNFKKGVLGTKVNDKTVFSSVVPVAISSYEFYETDYLRFKDPQILESPMNNWLKYGVVKVQLNGQTALITDYLDGQDPIQVLYDAYQVESTDADNAYFKNTKLTNLLNLKQGFFIFRLDDFVVISESRAVCESIVGDYKMGNTLSQNQEKSIEIYGLLPQKVNYRIANKTQKLTESVSNSRLLTTVLNQGNIATNSTEVVNSISKTFLAGNVKDIAIINENQFFVLTNESQVVFFENDKKKWEFPVEGVFVGDPQLIDIYANDKTQLLVSTAKKIYVIDINGNSVNGFPIQLDSDQVSKTTPIFYRWKGNGYFIATSEKGRLIQFDNQGRELAEIRTQLNSIEQKPLVWVSANKPFLGVVGDGRFEMIQADTRKSFRIFNVQQVNYPMIVANEAKLFGMNKGQLIAYDQKGGLHQFDKFGEAKILPIVESSKGLLIKEGQRLKLYNFNGLHWGTIQVSFNDLADAQLFTTNNGATFVAGVDAIENKVYLWKTNGEAFGKKTVDGSKFVRYTNGYLFTVIDNLIVRYPI